MNLNKIKGIIFDLDDTLFDCTGQLTGAARHRAAEVFSKACPQYPIASWVQWQETLSQSLGSSGALIKMGQQHHLSPDLVARARAAYNLDLVEHITPFPDTPKTLTQLAQRGYKLTLVTSGHPVRQRQKIERLQLTHHFSEKNGTLVLHDDQKSSDKTPFIQQAANHLNLPNHTILAVGDKLDAEITSANTLGMTTVRMRHGRQKDRLPQTPQERPDIEITHLEELLLLLPQKPPL
jgi:putative hydrolase of the HAD superfamily